MLTEAEKKSLQFKRSIYVSANIREGEIFSIKNIRIVRPGDGAPPHLFEDLLGKKAFDNTLENTQTAHTDHHKEAPGTRHSSPPSGAWLS